MMGQTLERLFEQKVLAMPKEVSSTIQYYVMYSLYMVHVCVCVCVFSFIQYTCTCPVCGLTYEGLLKLCIG